MAARRSFLLGYLIGAGAVLLGALPLLSVLLASLIAAAAGCDLNEGGISPCRIAGVDIGGPLTTMFVAGWLGLLTMPLAAGGVLFLIGLGAVDLLRRLR